MFIYHGCDNLKHLFSDFIGRSGIQPAIELVFENVQVSSTFDFICDMVISGNEQTIVKSENEQTIVLKIWKKMKIGLQRANL